MPVVMESAVWITPATSPSVMSATDPPALRTPAIRSAWRGRSRISAVISEALHALGLGKIADVVLGRRIEIDDALRIAGADRDLLHIDVGRMQQRAAIGHGDGGDRARHVLGAERGAFERIDRDIDLRAALVADLLADEQHGRLVELALADHHGAVDRQLVELAAHGVDRGLVGGLLGTAAAQARCRDRRALGYAHDLDRENALQDQVRLDGNRRHALCPVCDAPNWRSV